MTRKLIVGTKKYLGDKNSANVYLICPLRPKLLHLHL